MDLANKIVLITGGGTGIGAAIARSFAEAGAQVVICGRRLEKLEETAASIHSVHPLRTMVADVADAEQVKTMVEQVQGEIGPIDIVVNNAGLNLKERRLQELQPASWRLLIDANATGVFNVIYAVLPQMRAQGAGLIISISSLSGIRPSVLAGAAYSAAKHALAALMKVLSEEEEVNGIRATTISPGDVNTPLLEQRPVAVSAERRAQILRPEDVAAAALFVATLPAHVVIPDLVIRPMG